MADSEAIKLIRQKLKEFQTYSLFIEFELGIDKNGNATYTFTTGKNKSYFMSVDNQRSGLEEANVITVTLAFAPEPSGTFIYDVNLYDLMLTLESVRAKVKYGYIFPDGEIVSSNKYEMDISGYNIEIQNGLLIYTITGYSVASRADGKALGWRIIREIGNLEQNEQQPPNGSGFPIYNPIGLCWFLLNGCGFLEEYDFVVDDSVKDYPPVDFKYRSINRDAHGNKTSEAGYRENFQEIYLQSSTATYETLPRVDIRNFNYNDVLFNRIKEILNAARYKGQEQLLSSTKRDMLNGVANGIEDGEELIVYKFLINDFEPKNSDSKKQIVFVAVNTPKKPKEKIIFEWMSGESDDIVLNFSPNFNGAVARSLVQGVLNEEDKAEKENKKGDSWFVDSTGTIKPALKTIYTDKLNPISGNTTLKDELSTVAIATMFEKYLYTANLTTIGIPSDIEIQDQFEIIPLIYGKEHNTAGIYEISKIHDILSSGGFTTDFELMRKGSSSKFKEAL